MGGNWEQSDMENIWTGGVGRKDVNNKMKKKITMKSNVAGFNVGPRIGYSGLCFMDVLIHSKLMSKIILRLFTSTFFQAKFTNHSLSRHSVIWGIENIIK
jgi:hypothetical protein